MSILLFGSGFLGGFETLFGRGTTSLWWGCCVVLGWVFWGIVFEPRHFTFSIVGQ